MLATLCQCSLTRPSKPLASPQELPGDGDQLGLSFPSCLSLNNSLLRESPYELPIPQPPLQEPGTQSGTGSGVEVPAGGAGDEAKCGCGQHHPADSWVSTDVGMGREDHG